MDFNNSHNGCGCNNGEGCQCCNCNNCGNCNGATSGGWNSVWVPIIAIALLGGIFGGGNNNQCR